MAWFNTRQDSSTIGLTHPSWFQRFQYSQGSFKTLSLTVRKLFAVETDQEPAIFLIAFDVNQNLQFQKLKIHFFSDFAIGVIFCYVFHFQAVREKTSKTGNSFIHMLWVFCILSKKKLSLNADSFWVLWKFCLVKKRFL